MRVRLFQVSVVVWLLAVWCVSTVRATTYVVFRYDDFAGDAPGVRDSNEVRQRVWQAEQRIDEAFGRKGLSYVAAIIPRPNFEYAGLKAAGDTISFGDDTEKAQFIRKGVKEGRIEVALHGLSHTNYCAAGHRPAEFRERPYQAQLADIIEGKNILLRDCGLSELSVFVPPWNGWDDNTAKALVQSNLHVLSADRDYYYKSNGSLTIIPFTSQLWELESMLVEGTLPDDGIVVVLLHPAQIVESADKKDRFFGLERLEQLLEKLSKLPEVKVLTLEQLARETHSLTDERYRMANALWRQRSFWRKILPENLWPGERDSCLYLSTEVYSQKVRFWEAMVAAMASTLLIAGIMARWVIGLVFHSRWRLWADIAGSLLFCAGIISEMCLLRRGYPPTGIRVIPVFFAVSFFAGLLWRAVRRYCFRGAAAPQCNSIA